MRLFEQITNRRMLVIDDNKLVHADFQKFLGAGQTPSTEVDDVASELFGETTPVASRIHFQIDSAYQGQEGLEMVTRARQTRQPYTVAFVDVRMPPGMDGVETTEKILRADPEIHIVICSAYSDYSIEDFQQRFGDCDRLLLLGKPFTTDQLVDLSATG